MIPNGYTFFFFFEAASVMSTAPEVAVLYLSATGDSEGVKSESGSVVLNCWQEQLGGFLLCYNILWYVYYVY